MRWNQHLLADPGDRVQLRLPGRVVARRRPGEVAGVGTVRADAAVQLDGGLHGGVGALADGREGARRVAQQHGPSAVELGAGQLLADVVAGPRGEGDRKSTRLNSSHANISYAVFCLKK